MFVDRIEDLRDTALRAGMSEKSWNNCIRDVGRKRAPFSILEGQKNGVLVRYTLLAFLTNGEFVHVERYPDAPCCFRQSRCVLRGTLFAAISPTNCRRPHNFLDHTAAASAILPMYMGILFLFKHHLTSSHLFPCSKSSPFAPSLEHSKFNPTFPVTRSVLPRSVQQHRPEPPWHHPGTD